MIDSDRFKRLVNRRIATATLANYVDGEPTTLLLRFTDGGTATIEVDPFPEIPCLSIEVDGYS